MPLPSDRSTPPPRVRLGRAAALIGAVALLEGIAIGLIYFGERLGLERDMFRTFAREGPYSDRSEYELPGVRQPPTRPAAKVRLADTEEVLGVEVGSQARAYWLRVMRDRPRHIVNDIVGGVPITVTYCDLAECVRAFTDPQGEAPLEISLNGLKGERMVLKVGGINYLQDTGEPIDPGVQA
ncbi:MAG: DUF3179 domain-containing protein, partial [Isosphaeraceae bacterium]|nr:DUF3179 domain-containing protein [Isosphaeraceae bacterium]